MEKKLKNKSSLTCGMEVGRVQSVVILRTTTDLTLLLNLDGRDRHEEEGT